MLALTEADRLACFGAYPEAASQDVQRMFRDFDRGLAAALGIELHSGEGLEVASTVSTDWWDDGAWDLSLRGGAS
ncbi:MAG: hypothetical protein AAF682_26365 [Planctomycetota bacterium]